MLFLACAFAEDDQSAPAAPAPAAPAPATPADDAVDPAPKRAAVVSTPAKKWNSIFTMKNGKFTDKYIKRNLSSNLVWHI